MNILAYITYKNALIIVFQFFFLAVSGWAGETLMESCVRRRFVNKGAFKGPWVPVHGWGGFSVVLFTLPIKEYPLAVFILCAVLCTAVEYLAAVVLENGFKVKGWDYTTYPYAYWCNYKGRIALTTSILFGLVGVAVVYFYWDAGLTICNALFSVQISRFSAVNVLLAVDVVLCALFFTDVFVTGGRYIKNKKHGVTVMTIGVQDSDESLTITAWKARREAADTAFDDICRPILTSEKYRECKKYIQHGNVSIYMHCFLVARLSYRIALFFNLPDTSSLVRAALLHDFFLYDWHTPEKMWSRHGWTHPVAAADNAVKYFNISLKEYSLIRTHMWPWTPFHPPKYKEGWIICTVDKFISLGETLHIIRQPRPPRVLKPAL